MRVGGREKKTLDTQVTSDERGRPMSLNMANGAISEAKWMASYGRGAGALRLFCVCVCVCEEW